MQIEKAAALQRATGKLTVHLENNGSHYEAVFGESGTRVALGDTLDAMADAVRILQPRFGETESVVVMKKLSRLEQLNLRRSLEAQGLGERATLVGSEAPISPKQLEVLTHPQFELAKTKFSPARVQAVAGGEECAIPFTAPSKTSATPSLTGEIVAFVRGKITRPLATKIEGKIRVATGGLDPKAGVSDFHRSLQNLRREIKEVDSIRTEVHGEQEDAYFVFRPTPESQPDGLRSGPAS